MQPPLRPEDRQNFNGDIQILRAIAALLVIVAHSGLMLFPSHDRREFLPVLLGDLGNIGVAIFFAISGYIMLHTNMTGFGQRTVPLKFLLHRFLRVTPIYWIATLAAFVSLAQLASKSVPTNRLLLWALFVPYYSNVENSGFFPVLGVGWTLNMEMLFYVLFAVALVFRKQIGLALLMVVLLGLSVYGLVFRPGQSPALKTSALAFYSNDIMTLFAVGVLIRWFQDSIRASLAQVGSARFSALFFPAALATPVVAAIILEPLRLPATQRLLQCLSALPLVAAVTSGTGFRSMPRKGLLFLGDASYSLYIFHTLILLYLAALWRVLELNASVALFVVDFAVALTGSIACHLVLERTVRTRVEAPLRRWVDRRIRPGSPVMRG